MGSPVLSWPPEKGSGGGSGGTGADFNLQNNSSVLVFDNQYTLPIGGWTIVPFNIQEGAIGFLLDRDTHILTVENDGPLSIVARAGVIPNLLETGRMRLTLMITKNGIPIGQGIGSALAYDAMCAAQAVATEFFRAGDQIEIHALGDGVDWVEPFVLVQPDRGLNSLQVAYLTPEVIV